MADLAKPARESLPPGGPDAVVEAYMKDVDRTLLRENLKLSVDQRFEKFERVLEYATELREAGRRARKRA
jgi:hypothetical protein